MKFSPLAFFLAAASLVAGEEYVRCGTVDPSSAKKADLQTYVDNANITRVAAAAVDVDVYVHVVTTSSKSGQFTQTQVNNQVRLIDEIAIC